MLVHMNMTRGQTYRIRDVFTPFRNGAERFFLAAVLFDVFLVIAGIPAILGILYFYKTGVSGLSGALLAAGSIFGLIFTFYVLLTYRMVFFFLLDHPQLSVRDAFRTCRKFYARTTQEAALHFIQLSRLGRACHLLFRHCGSLDQSLYDADAAYFLSRRHRRTGSDSRPRLRSGGKALHRIYLLISYGQIRSSDLPFVYTQLSIISHQEEFTMNEKDGAIRDASVLGVPKMLILGLQHMFAMFGATILVPILVNSYFGEDVLHVQVTLICAGIGTLFFHLCSKFKVPAFLGSSFAFLGVLPRLQTWIPVYSPTCPTLTNFPMPAVELLSRVFISDSRADYQACRCQEGHAFSSAGRNRSDHHLHRTEPCRFCHQQRFHQLASRPHRSGYDHRFQYLGQGNV